MFPNLKSLIKKMLSCTEEKCIYHKKDVLYDFLEMFTPYICKACEKYAVLKCHYNLMLCSDCLKIDFQNK